MIRKILILMLIMNPSWLYAMGSTPAHKYIPVRVLVLKTKDTINMSIKGPYKVVDFDTKETLRHGKGLREHSVSINDIDSTGIKVLLEERARIYINKRQFRGDIDIIKDKENNLLVINHIDVEEYLYGVLYHEVSHRWPIEILKAQAIAARTYALYEKLISKNKFFDLTSDIYSQVYGGRTSEKWNTNKAVNLTMGLILTYNGQIFPAYYHATCGGRTSDVISLWNIDVPALKGTTCNFCKDSPHYEWKKELKMDYIEEKLNKKGITSIDVLKRDRAGRILELVVKGKGSDLGLSGNKFRLQVGPNVIRSANFEVEIKGRFVTFLGHGWGHGIGMCQWGAYGMARKGYKAEEILEYYYPGADIVRVE
ncbi:MAG: SpoIID/LytB domain-containing protein [Candidatus Omnitrophica bacterium]|nr:SpoIID/LytB domain-containing protein [Candidatus Omnitrophota bacterium]